jgi:hypothetical protein
MLPDSPERELAMRATAAPLVARRGHIATAPFRGSRSGPEGGGLHVRAVGLHVRVVDELAAGSRMLLPHGSWLLGAPHAAPRPCRLDLESRRRKKKRSNNCDSDISTSPGELFEWCRGKESGPTHVRFS